jgi:hypothetical protein
MVIKYEKTGFKEETKAGARGQNCPFCGGIHMVLHPNASGVVMHCSKTGKVVAKVMKDEVREQGRDDLARLPVYPAGKRLARKHGLKAMMNTDIWDRLSAVTNQGSSKLSIKDKGVQVGRRESMTRQLLQKVCEDVESLDDRIDLIRDSVNPEIVDITKVFKGIEPPPVNDKGYNGRSEDYVVKSCPIKSLYASQNFVDSIDTGWLRRFAKNFDSELAEVKAIEASGKVSVYDGHHTVVAAFVAGHQNIDVKVYQVGDITED